MQSPAMKENRWIRHLVAVPSLAGGWQTGVLVIPLPSLTIARCGKSQPIGTWLPADGTRPLAEPHSERIADPDDTRANDDDLFRQTRSQCNGGMLDPGPTV